MMLKLRELRKKCGLTMKELGAEINAAESTISQYETGKRQPDYETLLKLGEFFGVSVDYLLTGEETKKTPTQEGEREITFDDFTFAMQNESKDLTEADKQILLSMAKQLNDARKKKNGESE